MVLYHTLHQYYLSFAIVNFTFGLLRLILGVSFRDLGFICFFISIVLISS